MNSVYAYLMNTPILNHSFLGCVKAEIWALTVCIVINGEKFQSGAVTLTLTFAQCQTRPSYFHNYATIFLINHNYK